MAAQLEKTSPEASLITFFETMPITNINIVFYYDRSKWSCFWPLVYYKCKCNICWHMVRSSRRSWRGHKSRYWVKQYLNIAHYVNILVLAKLKVVFLLFWFMVVASLMTDMLLLGNSLFWRFKFEAENNSCSVVR